MAIMLLALSRFFACLPEKVLRFRTPLLALLIVLSVFMFYGALTRTSLDMTIDSFIDQDDPAIAALNEFRSQFGSDDSVFLVYRAKDANVFSAQSLQAVRELTEQLENWQNLHPGDFPATVEGMPLSLHELSNIRRVQSLANLRLQSAEGDTLRSDRLVPTPVPEDAASLYDIQERALNQDDFRLAFYSADSEYGALMIQTFLGARPEAHFVPAINAESVELGDSFSFSDDFSLAYDEEAIVEEVPYQTVGMFEYSQFFNALRAVYSQQEHALEFYPVGNAPMMEFVARVMQQMLWLAIAMIAIFVLLLRVLFRSLSAVVWPLLIVMLSVLWTWGTTAWLGIPISTMISLTILLVFAVGIADCMHVFSAYFASRQEGHEHASAIRIAYEKTGLAIFVTTVTTMAGVLALTFSDLIPLRVFGLMSAGGVLMALLLTTLLLPILLSFWRPSANASRGALTGRLIERWYSLSMQQQVSCFGVWLLLLYFTLGAGVGLYIGAITLVTYVVVNWQESILHAVPGLVAKNRYVILGIFAVVFAACLYGTSQIRIDSNLTELTREGSSLRVAYDIVDENMAGAQNLEIMVDSGRIDGMMDPELLRAMDRLQQRIEERYPEQVSRTYSLVNIVKDTNRIMNDNNSSFHRLPDSEIMVAQLLYLFNSANPEDRRQLVSDDYGRSHITVNAYNAGSYQYQRFFDELSVEINQAFAPVAGRFPDLDVRVTGTIPLMMRATDEIARSQYSSFLLALAVISVIMILTLASLQAGVISIIPNLIPPLLAFGLMGLLGIPLDTDTLLIAPVIIGIAVDDTIHFMTHYRMELLKCGNMQHALRSTVNDVGKAVMFTTMVLGLGFAILSFSDYMGMAKIGFFGSLAIFSALLCDLFLLPAIMLIFKPRFGLSRIDAALPEGETV